MRIQTVLRSYEYPSLRLGVRCSKGTYVRSLAQDIGQRLGCGAHLHHLRRTRSGPFCVEGALSLQQIDAMDFDALSTRLLLEVPM